MKFDELKQLDDAALKAKLVELAKGQMALRFQRATGQLEKTHPFKQSRRTAAQIKTLLSQRAQKA